MFALRNCEFACRIFYDAYLFFLLWVTVCNIRWGQVKSFSTQIVWSSISETVIFFIYSTSIAVSVQKKKEHKTKAIQKVEATIQFAQSWKRKQSLAIFHTGWSLLGEAWAVNRKFWLKYLCLFPSNFTEPAVTTNKVVWPWVACSVDDRIK